LRIAAGDENFRGWVFAMHAMDGFANVFIGGSGYGATV
jgi:hypothetical protein